MNELFASARNLMLTPNDDGTTLVPVVEAVMVFSEVNYALENRALTTSRKMHVQRFVASPDKLRALAQGLIAAADDADALARQVRDDTADTSDARTLERQLSALRNTLLAVKEWDVARAVAPPATAAKPLFALPLTLRQRIQDALACPVCGGDFEAMPGALCGAFHAMPAEDSSSHG